MSRRTQLPDTPWQTATPGDALAQMLYYSVRQALAEAHAEAPPIQPRLYSVAQAAVYLGRPVSSVKAFAKNGRLRRTASDSRLLFDRQDLDAFVEEERRLAAGKNA